jgi:hypothetical protein
MLERPPDPPTRPAAAASVPVRPRALGGAIGFGGGKSRQSSVPAQLMIAATAVPRAERAAWLIDVAGRLDHSSPPLTKRDPRVRFAAREARRRSCTARGGVRESVLCRCPFLTNSVLH